MNAIITAATGYGEPELQPFLRSIQRACPHNRVFLIAFRRDFKRTQRLKEKYPFVEPIYVCQKLNRGARVFHWIARYCMTNEYSASGRLFRFVGRYWLHTQLERYFVALDLIRAHRNSFVNVLLTDSRDVVFQDDPFARLNGKLVSGLEEKTIGRCSLNSAWIRHLYGTQIHRSMSEWQIVCSGVTLGPTRQIEMYLAEMCREIRRCVREVVLRWSHDQGGHDQGIHNYIIFTGKVNPDLTGNREGFIATLHHERPTNFYIDEGSGALVVQGSRPAIVHQYDRHPALDSFFREGLRG